MEGFLAYNHKQPWRGRFAREPQQWPPGHTAAVPHDPARGAVAFLDWLDANHLTLGGCQQADLDRWLADESAVCRAEAGEVHPLGTRRQTHRHLPSRGRQMDRAGAAARSPRPLDTACRLLHDEALKPEDRLAGLLVLLYAQGATAISRMTVSQIQVSEGAVRLRLGRVPIELPEPVAALARTVAASRKGHATIGTRDRHPGSSPEANPDGRSAPHGRPSGSASSGSTPDRHAAQRSSSRGDPCRDPRPHPRHLHRCRRHLAAPGRGRLGRLRRRHQPPSTHPARHSGSSNT